MNIWEKFNLNPYLTPYTKSNLRGLYTLKVKEIKPLEKENIFRSLKQANISHEKFFF